MAGSFSGRSFGLRREMGTLDFFSAGPHLTCHPRRIRLRRCVGFFFPVVVAPKKTCFFCCVGSLGSFCMFFFWGGDFPGG